MLEKPGESLSTDNLRALCVPHKSLTRAWFNNLSLRFSLRASAAIDRSRKLRYITICFHSQMLEYTIQI